MSKALVKNVMNRTKQKYMHRTRPINFARIRAQLRAKKENGEEITQAEMFIETRKSRKGKELDEETQSAIAKLEDSIQNSTKAETFQSLFGNEKPGRVRCYGRTVTPLILKKNEEIASMKKEHSNEVAGMKREIEGLKSLVKTMLKQQNPDLNEEEVDNVMAVALGYENSVGPHSSASSHVPHQEEHGEEEHFPQAIEEDEEQE